MIEEGKELKYPYTVKENGEQEAHIRERRRGIGKRM